MSSSTDDPMPEILLVEDSPTDVLMTQEALRHYNIANPLHVVEDGEQAIIYLQARRGGGPPHLPGLIILDLNLPRKSGREVLKEIKEDAVFTIIPVVILTTSKTEEDILKSYKLHANCYITKPVDFTQFTEVVRTINEFWLGMVTLPNSVTP